MTKQTIQKRIAIVAQGLSGGGAERVASILANHFCERGYRVLFVAVYNDRREYALRGGIGVFDVRTEGRTPLRRLLDRNNGVYRALKAFSPDVTISFLHNETARSVFAGLPVIFSLRNDPQRSGNGFWERRVRNAVYRRAKAVVFQTEGARAYFGGKIGQKGVVIPNPLETASLPFWRDRAHNHTFVTACRLNEQKNLPMMIGAFCAFHARFPAFRLEIYGEGELRERLQAMIDGYGASEYIRLMGRSSRIHEIMAQSFAFVLSSDYEGLSNAMLEALAIGLPCICTDCPPGGARAYIRPMENGLLVPCGDESALCEAMCLLADDAALCRTLSQNAVGVRERLERDRNCAEWEKLL